VALALVIPANEAIIGTMWYIISIPVIFCQYGKMSHLGTDLPEIMIFRNILPSC